MTLSERIARARAATTDSFKSVQARMHSSYPFYPENLTVGSERHKFSFSRCFDPTAQASTDKHPPQVPRLGSTEHYDSLLVPEFNEPVVSTFDWLRHVASHPLERFLTYLISLFPIVTWIYRYNLVWLYSDLIAGITVGVVLVPQSMSYAQLAGLPAEYGLYSSFVGVFIYCFFATSKDVSIGPVAVMSLQVSKVIQHVYDEYGTEAYSGPEIATVLALLCGAIAAGIGILRLGFILEFIPVPAVMGFITGSALNIVSGQVPALLGIGSQYVNTRDSTYKVIINTLRNLKEANVNAAFGMICLAVLYIWKYSCVYIPKRYPKAERWCFYLSNLRNAVVIIFATLISWLVCRSNPEDTPIKIIRTVPSGLRSVGVMTFPPNIMSAIAPELPVSVIVLLLEHISISKSFGRINDYKIVPDQELIAIGVTNLVGTFFNAYPATGSFSRSALKAKCGVRTPLAGIYTGGVVLLALYALTSAFYWIPKAALSAIIIHAVGDLIASYKTTTNFWRISPLEAGIFLVAIVLTVFTSIEIGIYFAIAASAVVLLFKIAHPAPQFLGRAYVAQVLDPSYIRPPEREAESSASSSVSVSEVPLAPGESQPSAKIVWVPLNRNNINPAVPVYPPPPGVVVFRPCESFTYPNASYQNDALVDECRRVTRRGKPTMYKTLGERPWNDRGPRKMPQYTTEELAQQDTRPVLRAVVFDFSSVTSIDSTGVQLLVDTRNQLNQYADREVEFHFAGILNPWIRRALLAGGFGVDRSQSRPAHIIQEVSPAGETGVSGGVRPVGKPAGGYDEEKAEFSVSEQPESSNGSFDEEWQRSTGYVALNSTQTPFFHLEIPNLE